MAGKKAQPVESESEAEDVFEVEKILDHKGKTASTLKFRVHWKGYPDSDEDTWEPEAGLDSAPEILAAYLKSIGGHPFKKPKPTSKPTSKPASGNKEAKSPRKSAAKDDDEEAGGASDSTERPVAKRGPGRPPKATKKRTKPDDDGDEDTGPKRAKKSKSPAKSKGSNGVKVNGTSAPAAEDEEMDEEEDDEDELERMRLEEEAMQAKLDARLKAHEKEPNWEAYITHFDLVQNEPAGSIKEVGLKFHVNWQEGGDELQGWVGKDLLRRKAPQHMIDFYERHLRVRVFADVARPARCDIRTVQVNALLVKGARGVRVKRLVCRTGLLMRDCCTSLAISVPPCPFASGAGPPYEHLTRLRPRCPSLSTEATSLVACMSSPAGETRRSFANLMTMGRKSEPFPAPPTPPQPVASTSQLKAETPSPIRQPRSRDELATLAYSATLTELDMEVSAIQTLIFEIQELRHAAKPDDSTSAQTNGKAAAPTSDVDQALMRLDERLEKLAGEVETASEQADGLNGFVLDKLESVKEDWTRVQADAEMLREELKEDKWLVVFRTVGQQADEMMDSLERVLSTCHAFIWDVQRRPKGSGSSHSSGANGVAGRLAASRASGLPAEDPESTQSLLSSFVSLHRSFHSKQKYYVPSTDRVLNILGKGIAERSTRNGEVLRRYADMKARWRNLQDRMSRVEREMAGVEDLLRETAPSNALPSAPETMLTPPRPGQRHASARSPSPFRKLANRAQGKHEPAPPLPTASVVGLPGTPSTSSSASDSPDRFGTWKRNGKAARGPRASSPTGHRYSQSANVTPRLTSSFFGPGDDGSPSLRAMSPPLTRPGEKPRWNTSTRLAPGEERALPPVAKRQSSYAFLSSAPPSRARSPVPSSSGRRTPMLRPSSPSAVSAASGRSVSYGGTYKARPSSPSRIPQPDVAIFGLHNGGDPDTSDDMGPTSLMQRALSPTPSSFRPGPRHSLSPSKPDQRALLGLRNMVQTPEPSLSARARRIEGLAGPSPSRIATPSRSARPSGVVSSTMLDRGGPYAPNPRDPLDVEVAAVVGRQPLRIAIERVDPALPRGRTLDPGESVRYRFADGEKVVQCKLVERTGRPVKVMARVGGLWQDLELYLLNAQATLG